MGTENLADGIDLFSYKGSPGFQKHSATSRRTARAGAFSKQAGHFLAFIASNGSVGATTEEAGLHLLKEGKIRQSSVPSARMRELEMAGLIVKTTMERKTTSGNPANVYVTAKVFEAMGEFMERAPVKPSPAQRAVMPNNLDKLIDQLPLGHVTIRRSSDGRVLLCTYDGIGGGQGKMLSYNGANVESAARTALAHRNKEKPNHG